MKLLIIEDEPSVAAFIKKGLEEQGYETQVVFDGQMAKSIALQNDFDLILLDIVIPYINGIELCGLIKEKKPQTPILMLTALGTTDDKLNGFDAGADDYLVKPFEFRELLARIKVLTNRHNATNMGSGSNKLKVADLELDMDKKIARRGNRNIDLTAKEFLLLEYFMRNKNKVVSRLDIMEKVWDINFDTGTNVVDVYVNILRKKIDKDAPVRLIQTKIGMGYMLSTD